MRFAFVPFVVLAASLAAAVPPTPAAATPPDSFNGDLLRFPVFVHVMNWPDVQAVSGTVSVDNLPTVQTVGGTVNIGNLPLDADGAVRVTSAPARQLVLVEVIPGGVTVESGTHYTSPSVSTSGYSWVGFLARGNWYGPEIQWRWAGAAADDFGTVDDLRNGTYGTCTSVGADARRVVCAVSGVEVRFHLYNAAAVPVRLESIQMYLIP